jgi:nickel/cobalt exporter
MAHPMGNFSVSHYTLLEVSARRAQVTYVLDLAEVPTYELLRDWKLTPASPRLELDQKAVEQAQQWMNGLKFSSAGGRLNPKFLRASMQVMESAGGLNTARITTVLALEGVQGQLAFEDHNYSERTGWKEIVIRANEGSAIRQASQDGTDRSRMLTQYPVSPAAAPQDLRASVEWQFSGAKTMAKIAPIEQPKPPVTEDVPAADKASAPRTDYLSTLLGKKQIGLGLMLIGMAVAFGLGAVHALSPGHGKTIVAAYLVGSRGTMSHAVFLGMMVTFTHTVSVFALGIATLFLSRYIVPDKVIPILGSISGLSIVAIGAMLFLQRLRRLRSANAHDHHHHAHDHDHPHTHDHAHAHDHGGHVHSHVPDGEVTMGSLIALGASGGLVPCPSALVLLLSSIALGHVGLGLILLVAFSLGLAGVLMAIGMLVLYAKNLLPDPARASRHGAFRWVPVLSALVIVCVGLLMTGISLGWVRPGFSV